MIPRVSHLRDSISAFWDFYVNKIPLLCRFGHYACWIWTSNFSEGVPRSFSLRLVR